VIGKADSLAAGVSEGNKLREKELYFIKFGENPQKINITHTLKGDILVIAKYFEKNTPISTYELEKNISAGEVTYGDENDPLLPQVIDLISPLEFASASLIQRRFRIGYARAARMLDQLETMGYIGTAIGSKPREVLKK